MSSSWNTGAWTETPVRSPGASCLETSGPAPPVPSPPWRYPHGPPPGGDPGEEPDSGPLFPVFPGNRLRCRSRARLPTGYRKHCPCPGRGRGRRPKAGRGGGAGEELLGDILSGEGTSPLPGPSPHGDSHHGPVHGEIPGRSRPGSALPRPSGKPARGPLPGTAHPGYTPGHCPRPGRGWGTERSAMGGMGRRPDTVCSFGIDAVMHRATPIVRQGGACPGPESTGRSARGLPFFPGAVSGVPHAESIGTALLERAGAVGIHRGGQGPVVNLRACNRRKSGYVLPGRRFQAD